MSQILTYAEILRECADEELATLIAQTEADLPRIELAVALGQTLLAPGISLVGRLRIMREMLEALRAEVARRARTTTIP